MSGPELDSSDVHETRTRLVAESPNAEEESCRMKKSCYFARRNHIMKSDERDGLWGNIYVSSCDE
jgi:hypothetical protein